MTNFKLYAGICVAVFLVILAPALYGQSTKEINVSGKIVNSKAEPEPAIITVKGTGYSVSNNDKGIFVLLKVSSTATIIISGVGIETMEVEINDRTNLENIVVKSKVVEETVVLLNANTGYQTLKPNEIDGAVTIVNNKMLNQQVGTNILNRLDGVASSVTFNNKVNRNPQSALKISIRGLSTINGPLDPIVVLDNFIYEGDINNINPDNIESVTVLKDAAATSIYGARGGNGVIVLTSKRSRFNQPLKVEYSSAYIHADKPDLYHVPVISSADYIDVEQFLFKRGYYNRLINFDAYYHTPFTPAVQLFIKARNGLISPADSASQINSLKQKDVRSDYDNYLYRNASTQQHSINVRGGSEKISYFFSAGFAKNISSLSATNDRINLNLQNDFRPVKNLSVNLGVIYSNNTFESGKPGQVKMGVRDVPYLSLTNSDGTPASIAPSYSDGYTDTVGNGKLFDWKYYPVENYKYDKTHTVVAELIGNLAAKYRFLKVLDVDVKYQYQVQTVSGENTADINSYAARDIINRFSQLDASTGLVKYIVPPGGILRQDNSKINTQSIRTQLNYQQTWGLHSVMAIGGLEVRQVNTSSVSNSMYGYNEDPLTVANVDYVNEYPTFVNNSYETLSGSPSLSNTDNRYVSVYSNFSYQYMQRYSASASIRRDGSNIFGVSTNDKWKPLWSVAAGWELSKEPFYELKALPYIKLRTSIGISGNVDVARSALPVAVYSTDPVSNLPAARISRINDPSLRWEQSKQFNFGIDFSGLKNIVTGSVDFYIKKGTDLYGITPYDYTAWGRTPDITKNVADMKGSGVELNIQSSNINRMFKWNTAFLFNYNTAKTTSYNDINAQKGLTLIGDGNTISPAVGKPLYGIAAYRWAGLDTLGDPQGYLNGEKNKDYAAIFEDVNAIGLESESVKFIGSAIPLYTGSLINFFSYRQFTASINIAYRFGYYFLKPTLSYRNLFNFGKGHSDFADRWQMPGDENKTDIPALVYNNYPQFSDRDAFYSNSENNVLKADHIRLQYINLEYNFSFQKRKTFLSSLQLYANIANLGIIWRANDEKLDPENLSSIPTPRSYAIGLRASF